MTEQPPSPVLWEQFDTTQQIGGHVLCYRQVESTMDVAWTLAEAGASHGATVVCLDQTRGRGRFGRSWVSRPGESLTMSVLFRPPAPVLPTLSLTVGLAVVRAIAHLTGARATIRWPNDVRIGAKKVAGILTEVRVDTQGTATAVVGVGLNLTLDVAQHTDIRDIATSLRAETGQDVTVTAATNAVLGALDEAYRQVVVAGADLVASWRDALDTLGSRVTVRSGDEETTGVAEDVAADGSLLVRLASGQWARLAAGEITSRI